MTERVPGRNPFDPSFEQLPETLPIFPLSGVLLLPGGGFTRIANSATRTATKLSAFTAKQAPSLSQAIR